MGCEDLAFRYAGLFFCRLILIVRISGFLKALVLFLLFDYKVAWPGLGCGIDWILCFYFIIKK